MRDNISGGAITETSLLILLSVYKEPIHGYGMLKNIENMTSGRVSMGPGTLYGGIKQLSDKGWIVCVAKEAGQSKKEYSITNAGKEVVDKELKRMNELIILIHHAVDRQENKNEKKSS